MNDMVSADILPREGTILDGPYQEGADEMVPLLATTKTVPPSRCSPGKWERFRWANLSLVTRLLIGPGAVLLASVVILLVTMVNGEAARARTELAIQSADELDLLTPALVEQALRDEVGKIHEMLQARSTRVTLQHIRWTDELGTTTHAPEQREEAKAPDWFVQWLDLPPAVSSRSISAGDVPYGVVQVYLSPVPTINRIWCQFTDGLEALMVVMALAFCMTVVILKTSLRSLHSLRLGAAGFADGDYDTRVAVDGPPEVRETIRAFNGMATNIQELLDRLRRLGVHMEAAREQHYKNIARELHDSMGGSLSMIKLGLASLSEDSANGRQDPAQFASLLSKVDDAIRLSRNIITALRPEMLDRKGLVATIEWYVEEFRRVTDATCELDLRATVYPPAEHNILVFRILQEALTNVARHSGATRLNVSTRDAHGNFVLTISDNGCGIPPTRPRGQHSYGLLAMEERARALNATLDVSPAPSGGTAVCLMVPVNDNQLSLL